MELKIKYQYTYFIYPFLIEEKRYSKYILRLLKDKNCKLKLFDKKKDYNIYTHFLPIIKKEMFWTFDLTNSKLTELLEMENDKKSTELAKKTCTIFEYNLKEMVQGKIGEEDGIFFKIPRLEIICFKPGICFLLIKTHIEEKDNSFSKLLNFNYKFRDINSDLASLKNYENIRIQTDAFKSMEDLSNFIHNLTGNNEKAKLVNLDTEQFITYSYASIDSKDWNENIDLSKIMHEFVKYANFLPSGTKARFSSEENTNMITSMKYKCYNFNKTETTLLASGIDTYNYTLLPYSYENEHLYSYILLLYEKIALSNIMQEFKSPNKIDLARKHFIQFSQNIWIQEITNNKLGEILISRWKKALEIEKQYNITKNRYDLMYKEMNIIKNKKINCKILMVLIILVILNILILWFLSK